MSISFRDPAGKVFFDHDRVIRAINESGVQDFKNALDCPVLKGYVADGSLVKTFELSRSEAALFSSQIDETSELDKTEVSLVVEHEKVFFQSFPYEWTAEMLYRAAELTLDLHRKLLPHGMGLKDATPYNVLFRAAQPVFVDWLSFERRDPQSSVWLAQAQFIRTFLLPLLVNKKFNLSLASIFRVKRDGLEPADVYEMCGGLNKLFPPFLSLVTIPRFLSRKFDRNTAVYRQGREDDPEKAAFILEHQCRYLRRLLNKVRPAGAASSNWSEYVGADRHFTERYFKQKEELVSAALAEYKPGTVLDVGSNTGHFSRIAARSGAGVVSVDQDPAVVSRLWRTARAEDLDILPLVVDIARPSPGVGWRNAECPSFLDRARGRFDAVLMLALIHHLLVGERVPLAEILALASDLARRLLIIEFVPPDDPMFRTIARGRDHLFSDLTAEKFRAACRKHFRIVKSEKLADSNRELYLLEK